MPRDLSRDPVISREDLLALATARIAEAEVLRLAEHYAASIYLAGLAVECCLKAAICSSLKWDHLLGAFRTHDLEGLLAYSGHDRDLRSSPALIESFNRLAQRWSGKESANDAKDPGSVRYKLPASYDKRKTDDFFCWVNDAKVGVIPWLRSRIE